MMIILSTVHLTSNKKIVAIEFLYFFYIRVFISSIFGFLGWKDIFSIVALKVFFSTS